MSEFVVEILVRHDSRNEYRRIGSGFLLNFLNQVYLISAGHIVEEFLSEQLYYRFQREIYPIPIDEFKWGFDHQVLERLERVNNGLIVDYAVYKIQGLENGYQLCQEPYSTDQEITLKAFSPSDEVDEGTTPNPVELHGHIYGPTTHAQLRLRIGFGVNCNVNNSRNSIINGIQPGNSGGPILNENNKVIGMFTNGNEENGKSHFVTSEYIAETIIDNFLVKEIN